MSRLPDGTYVCNGPGCGADIGNGGIGMAVSVVDYFDGAQRHRHLCYTRPDDNGEPGPGCRDLVLGGLT